MKTEKLGKLPAKANEIFASRLAGDAVFTYAVRDAARRKQRFAAQSTATEIVEDTARQLNGEHRSNFVAIDDTKQPSHLVGVASVTTVPFETEAVIENFFVTEPKSPEKVGEALMDDVLESVAIAGYETVALHAPEDKVNFFKNLGFSATNKTTQIGEIEMRRSLPKMPEKA